MHGAIETNYKGYRFRSRLEARWAVFFDTIEIEWLYEPQGFRNDQDCWLPDFHLPKTNTWVEVKGSNEALKADRKRLAALLDWSSPVPGMCDSMDTESRGVLLLGPIPEAKFGVQLHPLIQHREGLHRRWAMFIPKHGLFRVEMSDLMFHLHGVPFEEDSIEMNPDHWLVDSYHFTTPKAYNQLVDGYRAARAARFEHGQVGMVQPVAAAAK
jgi:hypothetical protein